MKKQPGTILAPRRTPRQARATATVEAICEATVQVLLTEGQTRLTTTRVAERAGVSVGTMYQYFPHKRSLLFAVLQKRLDAVAETVEEAARLYHAQPMGQMIEGLVGAYVDAKTTRIDLAPVLYRIAGELDTSEMLALLSKRIHKAIAGLLASAPDATFDNLSDVTYMLSAVMAGATRVIFERGATRSSVRMLRTELQIMCRAYLTQRAR